MRLAVALGCALALGCLMVVRASSPDAPRMCRCLADRAACESLPTSYAGTVVEVEAHRFAVSCPGASLWLRSSEPVRVGEPVSVRATWHGGEGEVIDVRRRHFGGSKAFIGALVLFMWGPVLGAFAQRRWEARG